MTAPNETPKSPHVSDPTLAPFIQPEFDPAAYLNATLPALSLSSTSSRPLKQGQSATLAQLSSQTQDLLSQLNAHTTRLSAILTQLTDDILRSGARLAYEVEVLRGETTGLADTLTDGLKDHVEKFLPGGVSLEATTHPDITDYTTSPKDEKPKEAPQEDPQQQQQQQQQSQQEADQPPAPPPDPNPTPIHQLRTLTLIRSRLETVIKTFGEAMHWTLPPSDLSLTSSLISVSAPAEPSNPDAASREQKGKEFAAALRSEIALLVTGDPLHGAEAAHVRIQTLRDLARVWKGTAEEKARGKFVEGLVRLVEEKQREGEREREKKQRGGGVEQQQQQQQKQQLEPQKPQQQQQRSGGFLDNLQFLR